jgi:hypothetical protein
MSYRTRRSRDPWFDRLTTLSEVEGVSSKVLLFLDSGQSLRDFRNDRRGAHTTNIESFSTLLGIIALGILNGERTDKLGFLN